MFGQGRLAEDWELLSLCPETVLAALYFGASVLPCTIRSPLRKDDRPSVWLHTSSGRVRFRDFATGDRGCLTELLCRMWGTDRAGAAKRLRRELSDTGPVSAAALRGAWDVKAHSKRRQSVLQCRIRRWLKRDIEYWESYGVPLNWLKWAEVYPITHTILTVDGQRIVYGADRLAYVFVEHKEGRTTLKVYQPLNTSGRKWLNKNDKSVIGLWTKVPPAGVSLTVCSSLKDSLCLSANTGMPAVYVQGEGYSISKTARDSLAERYEKIYILFDNDEAGLKNGRRLAEETGFTNVVMPEVPGAKDVSDVFRLWQDKERFRKFMSGMFNGLQREA